MLEPKASRPENTPWSMFIDEVVVSARAGDGGRGCVSFRREKFEPYGGPNGGDGGCGGDVVVEGDHDVNNLNAYRFRPNWKAERGEHGRGSDQHGRTGKVCVLKVPPGTIVTRKEDGEVVAEILSDGERHVILKGGNGGWGNTRFKSSLNRAPRQSNPGLLGETGHRHPGAGLLKQTRRVRNLLRTSNIFRWCVTSYAPYVNALTLCQRYGVRPAPG